MPALGVEGMLTAESTGELFSQLPLGEEWLGEKVGQAWCCCVVLAGGLSVDDRPAGVLVEVFAACLGADDDVLDADAERVVPED